MEEQGQGRPGRSTELPGPDALQALATLKVELRSEHEKSCRAYFWFMHKNHQRRKPDLVWRSAIIQGIPGFWAIAVSFLLFPEVCCSGGGGGAGTFSFPPTLAGAVAEPSMVPLQGDLLLSGPPLLLEHSDH